MNGLFVGFAIASFIPCTPHPPNSRALASSDEIGRGSVVFCFVLSLSIFLALTFMMTWHFYLIISAQTTIEFYYNRFAASEARKQVPLSVVVVLVIC